MSKDVDDFGISTDADGDTSDGTSGDFGIEATTDSHSTTESAETVSETYADAESAAADGSQLFTQRGDSSDEVDPRRLHRDPTLSEIRWYYRRTFAKILVDKPIEDAFKNGLEFTGDNADEARRLVEEPTADAEGEGFLGEYRFAEKKARRDGFSLVFIGTRESGSDGVHESPVDESVDVEDITHLKTLTVDDLCDNVPHEQIKDGTGLDSDEYEVRDTGIVVNTDITSPDYRTPVGYVLNSVDPQFVHADRVLHLTWNPEVDGDYDQNGVERFDSSSGAWLGQYEGDSVLIRSYNLLKGITKGNWSIMQGLFRNASHLYSVKVPPDATEEEFNAADDATSNINAKSALVWPSTEYEVTQHESGGELEPEQYFDVVFDQVCAGQEMTKSVLFGTQSGTVSGSETDIKNYFNQVERYRSNRAENKLSEYLTLAKQMEDSRTGADFEYDVDVEWGPLFRLDKQTRIETLQNAAQSVSALIQSYVITPDEARELLNEDFVEVEYDDLTETQKDELDRIVMAGMGQAEGAIKSEGEYTNAPETGPSTAQNAEGGREGGMEQGQQTASSNPAGAGDSAVDELERLVALRDSDDITESEFETLKEQLIEDT